MKPTREELVKQYINLVYFYTKKWVNNQEDVDDIVQETYKKVFMNYQNFNYQNDGQLKAWMLTICRNIIFDQSKIKKGVSLDEIVEVYASDHNPDQLIEQEISNEQVSFLKQSLEKLDKGDYDIVRMRYFDEIQFKEIAAVLKTNEATAKMRCYRALNKLRKDLKNEI